MDRGDTLEELMNNSAAKLTTCYAELGQNLQEEADEAQVEPTK